MIKIFSALALITPFLSIAGDINCGGTITMAMGGHNSCSEGKRLAFRTEKLTSKWQCSDDATTDSVILSALMSGKDTYVATSNNSLTSGQSCTDLPNYQTVSYVIVYK